MNLHEYQARALLKSAGIPMPDGDVASTPSEAESIARRIGGPVVVKAQVHSGGRGKAGGVKMARTPGEAADHASHILGMTIKGLTVHRVLVVPAADIVSESYVGIIMDRATQRPVFMVSSAGGIDIEEVAAKTPEKIVRLPVDPVYGLLPHQALTLAFALFQDFSQVRATARMMEQLYRVFADSAPVLEKALARNAGLGWIGKHSNLISRDRGSWFFLGEVYTDLPLPIDPPQGREHCGRCTACMAVCPTAAIVAPYQVDARLCISYLTIELCGPMPVALRPLVGNRIYGCDDCQLACPWNRFARLSCERDFAPRHGLDAPRLTDLFSWSETEFGKRTEGSAIRRIGYSGWLRNVAVALGNAPTSPAVVQALASRVSDPSDLVREHVQWALSRHGA